jgi:proteasome lid subunit RPN8/RPN11
MELTLPRNLANIFIETAQNNHPKEIILLLRGSQHKNVIKISDFLVPPFGTVGESFASFPIHMLPIDFSIMGTVHSHPTGKNTPSIQDLHNFYGKIMIIIGYPYRLSDIASYSKQGKIIPVTLV